MLDPVVKKEVVGLTQKAAKGALQWKSVLEQLGAISYLRPQVGYG